MATQTSVARSNPLTLEQRRASHAWEKAQEGIKRHGKDYANDAKGLPALIMNSGLMQVMAFLHEKGGRHEVLAQHLRDWLNKQCDTPRDFEDFMKELFEMQDARLFQAITAEAFAWLKWLRQ
ncbi:MAG TPA: type III-B CRISPR module-associated protein Cmr5, partial [Burkholderiaceae bacterium]|nr:type III-B CRISPR module-associated protein Cmr5 [Burkholderiaceae bacterium]